MEHLNGILLNDISDHFPIFTITEHELQNCTKPPKIDDCTTRIITNKSLESFCCETEKYDWQSTLSKNDPTESYTAFFKDFFELYDKFFPIDGNVVIVTQRAPIETLSSHCACSSGGEIVFGRWGSMYFCGICPVYYI